MESLLLTTTLTAFASFVVLSLLAWRAHQTESRDAARVQRLSALAFPEGAPGGPDASFHHSELDEFDGDEFRREVPLHATPLFVEPERSGAASRRAVALAAVCLVMTVMVGTYRSLAGTTGPTSPTGTAPSPAP